MIEKNNDQAETHKRQLTLNACLIPKLNSNIYLSRKEWTESFLPK